MPKTALAASAAAALVALFAGQAMAHAHLLTSSPPADAATAAPEIIALHFSESPMARFSGVVVSTPAGMTIATKPAPASDSKTMSVAPVSLLRPGAYRVTWHAVTADTHRTQGAFVFTVK
jgi:methionine-rich copper-binding protein CopC